MSENLKTANLRREEPCGCWRDVVRRKVPKFYTREEPCGACGICRADPAATALVPEGAPLFCERVGQPILDAQGGFVTTNSEDIEEGHCEKHAAELNARQLEAARLIEAGDAEGAMRLMTGERPLALGTGDWGSGGEGDQGPPARSK